MCLGSRICLVARCAVQLYTCTCKSSTWRCHVFAKCWYFELFSFWSKIWIFSCNIWCSRVTFIPKQDFPEFHNDRKWFEWFLTILWAKIPSKIFIFTIKKSVQLFWFLKYKWIPAKFGIFLFYGDHWSGPWQNKTYVKNFTGSKYDFSYPYPIIRIFAKLSKYANYLLNLASMLIKNGIYR